MTKKEKEADLLRRWMLLGKGRMALGVLGIILLCTNIFVLHQRNNTIEDLQRNAHMLETENARLEAELLRYVGLEKGIERLQDNLIREAQIADNCLEKLGRKREGRQE